jgi:hypothetical protein
MTVNTYITEEMRSIVGAELSRRTSYQVSEASIRHWALAIYYPDVPPRIYWDAEHAARTAHRGIVAPEDFNPFAWMTPPSPGGTPELVRAGHTSIEGQLRIPVPPTTSTVNGGRQIEYGALIRPGDVITAVSRLASYSERQGRVGLMLFSETEDTWTNQRGEWVKTERMTLIRY